MFLDATHAAASEEEVQQKGALAALHAVAGDRALHRILPQGFLGQWDWLSQQVRYLPYKFHLSI